MTNSTPTFPALNCNYRKLPVTYRAYRFNPDFSVLSFLGTNWAITEKEPPFLHFHNAIELGHCLDGSGSIAFSDCAYAYHAGDYYLICPDIPHMLTSDGESHWEYIYFDPKQLFSENAPQVSEFLFNFCLRQPRPLFSREDDALLWHLAWQAFAEIHARQPFYQDCMQGIFLAMASAFTAQWQERAGFSQDSRLQNIIQVLTYMREHCAEPLSIQALAGRFQYRESSFRRIFKAFTGLSPLDYLQHLRIMEACRQLAKGQQSVAQIAAAVGYPSLSSFNRQFQQCMRMSPRDWLKNARQVASKNEVFSLQELNARHIF